MIDKSAYFAEVWSRKPQAITPRIHRILFNDGNAPVAAECHSNADRYVLENLGFVVERGWLIEIDAQPRSLVAAHSLVRRGSQRFEITADRACPFVPHVGTDEEFMWLARNGSAQEFLPYG